VIFAIIILTIAEMPGFRRKSAYARAESVEEIVKRYVVQCYASEGGYPPDLEYLAENYGLMLNEENYFYFYSAHGANLAPEIRVFARRER
jgi:hypothetical protein